jgi:hypothetical protein
MTHVKSEEREYLTLVPEMTSQRERRQGRSGPISVEHQLTRSYFIHLFGFLFEFSDQYGGGLCCGAEEVAGNRSIFESKLDCGQIPHKLRSNTILRHVR